MVVPVSQNKLRRTLLFLCSGNAGEHSVFLRIIFGSHKELCCASIMFDACKEDKHSWELRLRNQVEKPVK